MDELFLHVHPSDINNNQFKLSSAESHHFLKSLRGSVGDEVFLLDGIGTAFQSQVSAIDNSIVSGNINQSFANFGENRKNIHLALGLIKGKRMEIAIEKSVEFGVKSIHPILFDRCIKKSLNIQRLSNIVTSAAKQCGRSFFPDIKETLPFSDWVDKYKESNLFACHFQGKSKLESIVDTATDDVIIIVGPEGDFSDAEITLLNNHEVPLVNLGQRRLRSESACISSLISVQNIMEN